MSIHHLVSVGFVLFDHWEVKSWGDSVVWMDVVIDLEFPTPWLLDQQEIFQNT